MSGHKPYLPKGETCKEFTLFLDRDGVLNEPIVDDYARKPDDLIFVDEVAESLRVLSHKFQRIVLVTNQQGVGKQVMSDVDLENVHLKLYKAMKKNNVNWFDVAFYAPYLKTNVHSWRKPQNGMLLKAKTYFSDIDWRKSIMVGDSPGDMLLADSLGLTKVRIENPQFTFDNQDFSFASIRAFVQSL